MSRLIFDMRKTIYFAWLIAIVFGFASISALNVSAQKTITVYKELKGKQKALFDDWAKRQNSINGQSSSPIERFQSLSLSQGSTYQAITNALAKVKLKGRSKSTSGTAIDLISAIENIAGEEDGKGGDEQFRLYVKLDSGTLDRLEIADAFHRGKRNSFFHREYPHNYRQTGGAPSIQFSITEDGSRADIDIDYHSSSFPLALFNGHLRASNSDVRPHHNYRGYVKRWTGLSDWWNFIPEGLNTLKDFFKASTRDDHIASTGHPDAPDAESAAAAADAFFNIWLTNKDTGSA
ncbi:MAG: hypothetical protein KDB79_08980, partial [Acidobacteria bacterium]|nr:hypothetical protein [Acidobacteriota bacterium]